jgi:hypothetical protein
MNIEIIRVVSPTELVVRLLDTSAVIKTKIHKCIPDSYMGAARQASPTNTIPAILDVGVFDTNTNTFLECNLLQVRWPIQAPLPRTFWT